MTKVNFYDSINDSMLKFAVLIARHNGKWVFCKHKERNTWEVPGGHRMKIPTPLNAHHERRCLMSTL